MNNKCLKAIKEAYLKYGNPLSLDKIYNHIIESEGHEGYEFINKKTWKSMIRAEIYRHSSDSNSKYKPTKGDLMDLFYKVDEGIWGLRELTKQYKIEKEEQEEIEKQEKRYREGGKKTVTSEKTVRDSRLRKDYIEYLKNKQDGKVWCEICGQWEEIGEEMLQVHHLLEINSYEEKNKEYSTFDDVIAICPNCHRLIHIFGNIEDVKKIYNKED